MLTETERTPEISIETEMKKSYLDYAMSVIIGRALPDVRDGLKPVHRRVLFAMNELRNDWNKPYKKSARVVGDCFAEGTLVHTETGLVPIEKVEPGTRVQMPDGCLSEVVQAFANPPSPVVRVRLSNGYLFTVTPGQLFRVLNDDLTIGWEKAGDLAGKRILAASPRTLGAVEVHPEVAKTALAYIVGLLVSEGYLTDRGRSKRVGISMVDREPLEFFCEFCASQGISASWQEIAPQKEQYQIRHCVRTSGLPEAYEACSATCEHKQVPDWILHDRRLFAPFLAGFTDGDGHIRASSSKREAVLVSTSETLLMQMQAMLLDSGIHACLTCEDFSKRDYGEGCLPRYHLWITGDNAARFSTLIYPFLKISYKRENAKQMMEWAGRVLNTFSECIPGKKIFQELSRCHLGGGWYQDREGRKFRAGIKYPGGGKIRYPEDLEEYDLSFRQLEEWGILRKLERIGSPLASDLRHLMDTYTVLHVEEVLNSGETAATYDVQIADSSHEFLVHGCAVHNCIGKYHPHGDTAVYDTMVRMTQDFSLRYPLIDGQGNFGSIDGDSPAAMRYTEVRMSKIAHEMLTDLEKETVDFTPNYDESLSEPALLPARIPCLLVNGSSGIAVGMATNIPPHNLTEITNALIAMIDNPDISLRELMALVPGPDFPTAGIIYGKNGIYEAYTTGRGIIRVRARVRVERDKKTGMETIVVTEIPYQVNKARLIEKIAELMKDKQIEGLRYVRDESDREGMRIAMGVKKDQVSEVIVNQLYKHTQMENSFGIIFLAVLNKRPRLFSLKEMLEQFILYRREIIVRRTRYDLKKAEERAHILEGLKIALENLDEAVALIRRSSDAKEAKEGLIASFGLTAVQAQAILDMRLQRLTGLEREKILEEYASILKDIARYKEILSSTQEVLRIVKEELTAMQQEFGDSRRTEIAEAERELTLEDMIAEEDMVVTVSRDGYIKRNPISLYQSQRRGGKGKTAMGTKEEDFVAHLFVASTHHTFLFFTNRGKVYWCKVYEIPQAGRASKGKAIVNLLNFEEGERLTTVLAVPAFEPGSYIMMATKNGTVKKTDIMDYSRPRAGGIIALGLEEGDELIATRITDGTYNVFLGSASGQSIRFHESDVRGMGRTAKGVRGMKLAEKDYLVGMEVLSHGQTLFTATENGFGKRTLIDEYPVRRRGGKGVITIKTSKRNGQVIAILLVDEEDELMLMTDSGKLIRMPISGISVISRNTQGVKLMDLEADERVVGAARLAEKEEGDAPSQERMLRTSYVPEEILDKSQSLPYETEETENETGSSENEESGEEEDA